MNTARHRAGRLLAMVPLLLGCLPFIDSCSSESASATSPTDAGTTDSSDGAADGNGNGIDASPACDDLECKVDKTCGASPTKLAGKVYDPAGANPVYGAVVYIPRSRKSALPALQKGATCTRCADIALDPLAVALTDATGQFSLENVPVDKDVPLVIQIGKWRRQIKVDMTSRCSTNAVADGSARLPKKGSEGDMPDIAITTGGCDNLACLLRGIGIDDSEFVVGASTAGHVHMFDGTGGGEALPGIASAPAGTTFWNAKATMLPYDLAMLTCECGPNAADQSARQQMIDYANAGGRVFAGHFHNTWVKDSPDAAFKSVATFTTVGGGGPGIHYLETALPAGAPGSPGPFPKGSALAAFLFATGASTTLGEIQISDFGGAGGLLLGVNPLVSQPWVKATNDAMGVPRYFSFGTPSA